MLAFLTSFAQSQFISTLSNHPNLFPPMITKLTTVFLLGSPGILLSGTSLLPSALCSNLLLLGVCSWIEGASDYSAGERRKKNTWGYFYTIMYGSLAVVWTGWPFVGLVFLPIGLHMIHSQYLEAQYILTKKDDGKRHSYVFVVIDSVLYNKPCIPALNIFIYNTIGGSGSSGGDELYGVEPVSYYIKNLFLNCGLAWVCVCAAPVVYGLAVAIKVYKVRSEVVTIWTVVALWIGVLFSRPHKEERFLYPIYGLLAYIAADVVCAFTSILDGLLGRVFTEESGKKRIIISTKQILIAFLASTSLIMSASRAYSNYTHYHGYMHLFTEAYFSFAEPKQPHTQSLCMGVEWYRFPSHFFLPSHLQLTYIRDRFHGILPQPYAEHTYSAPPLGVNTLNQEELDRYLMVRSCDYIVTVLTPTQRISSYVNYTISSQTLEQHYADPKHADLQYSQFVASQQCNDAESCDYSGDFFEVIYTTPVLDHVPPPATNKLHKALYTVARAFYIPGVSEVLVPRKLYAVLRKKEGGREQREVEVASM
eukprot:gene29320-35395_t